MLCVRIARNAIACLLMKVVVDALVNRATLLRRAVVNIDEDDDGDEMR